jgi:hypothetical protein
MRMLDLGPEVVAFERGADVVVVNFGRGRCPIPGGEVLLASAATAGSLAPHEAAVVRG